MAVYFADIDIDRVPGDDILSCGFKIEWNPQILCKVIQGAKRENTQRLVCRKHSGSDRAYGAISATGNDDFTIAVYRKFDQFEEMLAVTGDHDFGVSSRGPEDLRQA